LSGSGGIAPKEDRRAAVPRRPGRPRRVETAVEKADEETAPAPKTSPPLPDVVATAAATQKSLVIDQQLFVANVNSFAAKICADMDPKTVQLCNAMFQFLHTVMPQ